MQSYELKDGDIVPLNELLKDGKTPFFRKYFDYKDMKGSRIERTIALILKNNPDPDLIRIYAVEDQYYDMELLNTYSSDYIENVKPDILGYLKKLHALGIVYIDLKHDNLGWSELDKKWKLFDFDCSGVVLTSINPNIWLFEPPNFVQHKLGKKICEVRSGSGYKKTDIDYAVFDVMFPSVKMTLSSPWYEHIKNGTKIFEGRRKTVKTLGIKKGDIVSMSHHDGLFVPFNIIIEDVLEFPTFEEALRVLGLEKVLPGVATLEEGVEVYKKYVSLETQHKDGVFMFKVMVL